MPQQTFILCPGQGAQHVGMGRDYHAASAAVRAIFGRASEVVGFDLAQVCFDGPVERLTSNFINGIKHLPVRFTPAPPST